MTATGPQGKKLPPPSQVTLAATMVIIGSVGVVAWSLLLTSKLHTLDYRQQLTDQRDSGATFGLGVDDLIRVQHVVSLVAGGCAAAAAVLGQQVLVRNRLARVLLSVLAVPLAVGGLFVGTFFGAIVAVATAMLWALPARRWFDGIAPPTRRPPPTWPPPPPAAGPGGWAPPSPPAYPSTPPPGGWPPPDLTNWPPPEVPAGPDDSGSSEPEEQAPAPPPTSRYDGR